MPVCLCACVYMRRFYRNIFLACIRVGGLKLDIT